MALSREECLCVGSTLGNLVASAAFGALEKRLDMELPEDCPCKKQVLDALRDFKRRAERYAEIAAGAAIYARPRWSSLVLGLAAAAGVAVGLALGFILG